MSKRRMLVLMMAPVVVLAVGCSHHRAKSSTTTSRPPQPDVPEVALAKQGVGLVDRLHAVMPSRFDPASTAAARQPLQQLLAAFDALTTEVQALPSTSSPHAPALAGAIGNYTGIIQAIIAGPATAADAGALKARTAAADAQWLSVIRTIEHDDGVRILPGDAPGSPTTSVPAGATGTPSQPPPTSQPGTTFPAPPPGLQTTTTTPPPPPTAGATTTVPPPPPGL